mmetsp:Transcript_15139/g.25136  ORF Transcript_15139/g.25136 Transcript_15139/m.25136 type:complete len:208 (+) Transcript_15139:954-1577(+)
MRPRRRIFHWCVTLCIIHSSTNSGLHRITLHFLFFIFLPHLLVCAIEHYHGFFLSGFLFFHLLLFRPLNLCFLFLNSHYIIAIFHNFHKYSLRSVVHLIGYHHHFTPSPLILFLFPSFHTLLLSRQIVRVGSNLDLLAYHVYHIILSSVLLVLLILISILYRPLPFISHDAHSIVAVFFLLQQHRFSVLFLHALSPPLLHFRRETDL